VVQSPSFAAAPLPCLFAALRKSARLGPRSRAPWIMLKDRTALRRSDIGALVEV
jgi:hypothetical protein